MKNLVIRPAVLDDLEAVWNIRCAAKELLKSRGVDQWQDEDPSFEHFRDHVMKKDLYVAETNAVIIGMAVYQTGDPDYHDVKGRWGEDAPFISVHRLAVLPAYLGQGVAVSLMEKAEQVALSQGLFWLRVDTHEDNRWAQRLFGQLGYTERGEIDIPLEKGRRCRLVYDKPLYED